MAAYTEMTYASWLAGKLEGFFDSGGSRWKRARVETKAVGSRSRADIVLSTDAADEVVIEVKRPEIPQDAPFSPAVVEQAREYARQLGVQVFATHNIQAVAIWQLGGQLPADQVFIAPVDSLAEFEAHAGRILAAWKEILVRLEGLVATGRPQVPLETSFAELVGGFIDSVIEGSEVVTLTTKKVLKDADYRRQFDHWIATKGRTPPETDKELEAESEVFAKQFFYAWCNQLLFYRAIQGRYGLPRLDVDGAKDVQALRDTLSSRFAEAMKVTGDFETVFVPPADILPECDLAATNRIVALIRNLDYYDFTNVPYDVLGRLFERLIVRRERHIMGQFFTPTPLADLIIALAGGTTASYLDPACGSGTFLVRAYNRIRSQVGAKHLEILPRVWGFDIAQYPAHLATVNLALQDLGETNNHPNVSCNDFFQIEGPNHRMVVPYARPHLASFGVESGDRKKAKMTGLGVVQHHVEVPVFDAVVGNPPYTRFQELSQAEFGQAYLETIRERLTDQGVTPLPTSEAGIYAYFVLHARTFLKPGGRLGFVLLRQWLDVEYGEALKRFILDHFKVLLAAESAEERWFQDAQMLPMFLILERCEDADARRKNKTRFVRLKSTLAEIGGYREDLDSMQSVRYWARLDGVGQWLLGNAPPPDAGLPGSVEIVEESQSNLAPESKWSHYFHPTKVFDSTRKMSELVPVATEGVELAYGSISGAVQFFVLTDTKNVWEMRRDGKRVLLDGDSGVAFVLPSSMVHPYVNKFRSLTYVLEEPPDWIFTTKDKKTDLAKFEPDELRGQELSLADADESKDLRKTGKKQSSLGSFLGLKGKGTRAVLHRGPLGYVEWGELPIHRVRGHKTPVAISELAATAARKPWYSVDLGPTPQFLLPSLVLQRFTVPLNKSMSHNSQNVYGATFDFAQLPAAVRRRLSELGKARGAKSEEVFARAVGAILNSGYVALAADRAGRYVENRDYSIGVKLELKEWKTISIPNPFVLDARRINELALLFEGICKVGPLAMAPRLEDAAHKKLDRFVNTEILGLSSIQHGALVDELRSLFESRLPPGDGGGAEPVE